MSFGFNKSKTFELAEGVMLVIDMDNNKIKAKPEKPEKKENPKKKSPFVKGYFQDQNGKQLNINGTREHGLKIDGSADEYTKKLERIFAWSSSRPAFNISTLYSIFDNAKFTQNYSSGQRDAIDNVYYKFGVFSHFSTF